MSPRLRRDLQATTVPESMNIKLIASTTCIAISSRQRRRSPRPPRQRDGGGTEGGAAYLDQPFIT